jgi:hypothetical protein
MAAKARQQSHTDDLERTESVTTANLLPTILHCMILRVGQGGFGYRNNFSRCQSVPRFPQSRVLV